MSRPISDEDLRKLEAARILAHAGPWAWRDFGKPVLVADHGGRDILLDGAKTIGPRRTLVKAEPGIPNMKLIELMGTHLEGLLERLRRAERVCEATASVLSEDGVSESIAHLAVGRGLEELLNRWKGGEL